MGHHFAQKIDNFFIRAFGLQYLRLVRDPLIHERGEYLVSCIKKMNRVGLRVLDVGCGSAIPLLYLNEFCRREVNEYVGIDLHTERLSERYQSVHLRHQFYNVNLDDDWDMGKFDVVCCFEVIEHIIKDGRLFRLLCAQVDDNGYLLVTTPSKEFIVKMANNFPGFDQVSEVQNGGHVRIGYNRADLQILADQNNMRVVSCDWISRFDVSDLHAYLRSKGAIGIVLYNFTHPRREQEIKFSLSREPEALQDTYYSIACALEKQKG